MSTRPSNPATALPPAQLRTWLSLLLFIHLFAIVVAVTSYASPSGLQTRLRSTLAMYLKPLNFDLTHPYRSAPRFYLTHATKDEILDRAVPDIDYRVEIGTKLSDPAADRISIPPAGTFPPARWNRYQALANAISDLAGKESSGRDGVLIAPLGAAALAEWKVKKVDVRCIGHLLPTIEDLASNDPSLNNPQADRFFGEPYAFQVLDIRGVVNVMRSSAAAEVAPVEKGE